jgi:hypothetical protein
VPHVDRVVAKNRPDEPQIQARKSGIAMAVERGTARRRAMNEHRRRMFREAG